MHEENGSFPLEVKMIAAKPALA